MNKITYQDSLLYPKILWQRPVHKYKPSAGRVMILAGSKNMSGAAILTCEAVFRSGTGILILGFPESLKSIYKGILPDAMTLELPETPGHTLAKRADTLILEHVPSCDVAIIGPGLSGNAETVQLVWELIFNVKRPIVLDSDAIGALIMGISVMRKKEDFQFLTDYFANRASELVLILTPGELTKLIQALNIDKAYNGKYVAKHSQEALEIVADTLSCTAVLSAPEPVIATNTGTTIITRLTAPNEATEASRDTLSGIVGSFIAQNPKRHLEAIATAVFLHTKTRGNIRYLSKAIKEAEDE